jgi:Rrf2 family protein
MSSEYAVHCAFYLALREGDDLTSVADIAAAQNLSESYVAKILQSLSRAGLVRSLRGPKGGYALGRNADSITLRDVVESVEGRQPLLSCGSAMRQCRRGTNCLVLESFRAAEARLYEALESTTIGDLVRSVDTEAKDAPWLTEPARTAAREGSGSRRRA